MKFSAQRRKLLQISGVSLGAIATQSTLANQLVFGESAAINDSELNKKNLNLDTLARDECYWSQVAQSYNLTDKVINLENGYWGVMAKPVLAAYQKNTEFVNQNNTYFARRKWGETKAKIAQTVANFLQVESNEIALTRGATEALQALITGYNRLKPGDKVLYADLDYSEMKTAIRWLKERRGVEVIKIDFPEPSNKESVLELYQETFNKHPQIKLMLLTHLNNWTGLIAPVKAIAKMAKQRGIDIILDAAHSVGQVDFAIKELGCDFVGVNLHKWVGAPIGCGVIYINKNKLSAIDTYLGKSPGSTKASDRIDTGTANFAAYMTIPTAIEFHQSIGTKAKQTRLKYLRDTWVNQVRSAKGIQILTPDEPEQVAALTSFRINNQLTTQANNALVKKLFDDFGVLTCRRTGPALGDCVRVTPSIYNNPTEMNLLAKALVQVAKLG